LHSTTSTFSYLLPWDFYPAVVLFCLAAGVVYVRGWLQCRRTAAAVGYAPLFAFVLGLVLVYVVMHTYVDYLSQHMLWIHRVQHLVLHHLGPFLMMLGMPWKVLPAGLSVRLKASPLGQLWRSPLLRGLYGVLQNPVVAPLLFVGLIYFWLMPDIHFGAMLSITRYQVMNWSMLLDGLLFWWLIFDVRPEHAVGRLGYGGRIVILSLIVPPQIIIGAHMALARESLYPVYNVCGRAWPVSPLVDQQIAGLVTWIPASMMSVVAALIVLRRWMRERAPVPVSAPVQGGML
jgi:putative membrane protein